MGDNSKIVKNSLILYIRLIVVSFIGLISSRFILQALGASDYGLYNVVGGVVAIMAFLNSVMISTTYRYIAFELGTGKLQNITKVFNISLVIHIAIALIVIIFASSIGFIYIKNYLNVAEDKVSDALFVFSVSIISVVVSIISMPFQGLITAKEKFIVIAPAEIFRSLLNLGIVILVVHSSGSRLRLYAILIALVASFPPVIYYIYCRKHFKSIIDWKFQKDKKKYKEMIGYSGWIMIGAGASVGETQGSALMINSFFGTILNAGFGIASQVNGVVKMFSQSLNQAVIPQITKSYSSGSIDRTLKLVIYASKYSFFLMLIPSLPILLETDFILNLWLKEVPEFTKIFIQIMLVNALITSMSAGIPSAIQATGKIKYFQIVLSSIMLLGLPIAYIGFKLGLPPYMILFVYTFTAITIFIIQNFMLKMILNFNIKLYLEKSFLKILYVLFTVIPIFFIRDSYHPGFLRFITISFTSIVWLLLAIYHFGIEKDEKAIIKGYLRNLIVSYMNYSRKK